MPAIARHEVRLPPSHKRPALFFFSPIHPTSTSKARPPDFGTLPFPSIATTRPIRALSRESKSRTNRSTLYGWALCGLAALGWGRLFKVRAVAVVTVAVGTCRWLAAPAAYGPAWPSLSFEWLSFGVGSVSVRLSFSGRRLLLLLLLLLVCPC